MMRPQPTSLDFQLLARVDLFRDLTRRDLDYLASNMQRRRFDRGRTVFMKGEPGLGLYVIEKGQVKIIVTSDQGDELILRVLGPGDTFGEFALLDGQSYLADAVAYRGAVLLVLRREDLLPIVKERPAVVIRLLAILGDWLRRFAALAEDEAFLGVHARLAKLLLELSSADARPGEDGLVITPRTTQAELAGMIGATRRSVNKWLGYYQREGLVRCQGGHITVLRPDLLRRHIA